MASDSIPTNGITVIGNICVDRIDGSEPRPGGCPVFAPYVAKTFAISCRIVTHLADADRPVFDAFLDNLDLPITVMSAKETSAFDLRYNGDHRVLEVQTIGQAWSPEEISAAQIDPPWVHVAPLLRSDFPLGTLALLAAKKRCISYDGQGLVRASRLGRVKMDSHYDRTVLNSIDVLKLNDEEAGVIAQGEFDVKTAERLGVKEIVVTLGPKGCDVYAGGEVNHIPARPVYGVHNTGAGDAFMVAYIARRASGAPPAIAAQSASEVVASMLESRRVCG